MADLWTWIIYLAAILGVGGAIAVWRAGFDIARRLGLVAKPMLGEPEPAWSNHADENHLLWQIPVRFRSWGVAERRDDFTVFLSWLEGPPGSYQMPIAGGARPVGQAALRPTRIQRIMVAVRSLIGEVGARGIRIATEPTELRIDAPKDVARLVDLGVAWNMASERIDFPPDVHHLVIEIRHGDALVHRAGYRLDVPRPGEDNSRFILALEWTAY